ncbi:MAG: methyltransferase domain-containing protein [Deltaproteobacteria bacterium]|nr:methyltransferase domain-containing protein [Deltaproteobacteria bacterium]
MDVSSSPLLSQILCCPECGGDLLFKSHSIVCKQCSKKYEINYINEKPIPVLLSSQSDCIVSPEEDADGLPKKPTLLNRIAHILWPPEPARFYGDLQRKFNTKNYHRGVEEFIKRYHPKDKNETVLIDLGGGKRRLKNYIINIDVFASSEVDVIADARFLPLRSMSIDGAILQSVLEHVAQFEDVLRQSYRVLKFDGLIFCEVPFYYPVHAEADFARFTKKMLTFLLEKSGFSVEEFRITMGPFSALSLSCRVILSAILSMGYKKLFTAWYILIGWLTFWLRYLDIFYPRNQIVEYIMPSFYIVARKGRSPHA